MENEKLNENEVEKVAGGFEGIGRRTKSVCYKCGNVFKEYVVPTDNLTGCPPMCPECRRKRYEELEQKNQKFKVDVKEFLKEVEKSTNR